MKRCQSFTELLFYAILKAKSTTGGAPMADNERWEAPHAGSAENDVLPAILRKKG